ncbi:MAG: DUF2799 domain-containing protein [Pseudomonadota bacterium]
MAHPLASTQAGLVGLALLGLLGSCASLSEEACRGGDWSAIGAADGAKGRQTDFLSKHAEACGQYGISPDLAEWEVGRRQGLAQYCTPANVYAEGTRGRSLSPVCPATEVERLAAAHETGRQYWRLERRIERLESDLRDIRRLTLHDESDEIDRGALLLKELRIRNEILSLRARQREFDRPPPV